MIRKAEGVILRSQKLGETSKILTLFSREAGKLKVVAKGARSPRSRFGGTLEPLNQVTVVYYHKETRELQTLSQADVVNDFRGIRASLEKWTVATACCELMHRLEFPAETTAPAFRQFVASLEALDEAQMRVRNVFRHFQIQLLRLSGFTPNFARCLHCGGQPQGEWVAFEIRRGGFVGQECGAGQHLGFHLRMAALRGLRDLASHGVKEAAGIRLGRSVAAEIDAFLRAYFGYHFEGMAELRSLSVLQELEDHLKKI